MTTWTRTIFSSAAPCRLGGKAPLPVASRFHCRDGGTDSLEAPLSISHLRVAAESVGGGSKAAHCRTPGRKGRDFGRIKTFIKEKEA